MVYLLESRTHLTLERLEIIGHYTDIMQGKELYFAFASNLSERKMKERGAKFTSRESAVLRGITPDEGSAVHGALYICEKGSMCKMDHEHIHEGNRFHRVIVKVEKRNG